MKTPSASTLPMHPTTSFTWARALLLITAGALGVAMLVGYAQLGPVGAATVLQVLVGWSFVACGVLLWTRRPANRLGPLMSAVGMVWLLGRTMFLVQQPVVFTAGMWLSDLWAVGFAYLLLSFPTGRLSSRFDQAIVGIFLFVSVPLEFLWLLFFVPENGLNALAIAPNEDAAHVIDTLQRILISLGGRPAGPRQWSALAALERPGSSPDGARRRGRRSRSLLQSASWIFEAFGISVEQLYTVALLAVIAIPVARPVS